METYSPASEPADRHDSATSLLRSRVLPAYATSRCDPCDLLTQACGLPGGAADCTLAANSGGAGLGAGRLAAPEWYDVTWNPIVGCSPAGPGCEHCQARRTVAQLARMGGKSGARYAGLTVVGSSSLEWTGEVRVRAELLTWPLLQHRPRRILAASLSDLFHEGLATETIDTLHAVMAIARWHQFLVLTRRAERMHGYYADPDTPARIAREVARLATAVLPMLGGAPGPAGEPAKELPPAHARHTGVRTRSTTALDRALGLSGGAGENGPERAALDGWPLPNLWPGVAVEDQSRIGRIGHLLEMPATMRWVCFEPLLGAVCLDAVTADQGGIDALGGAKSRLDWVVVGGEYGADARPTRPAWVRALRDRCIAAGIPFLFKGWGACRSEETGQRHRFVRVGRGGAGRLLDGRCWDEIPVALDHDRNGSKRTALRSVT